MCCVRGGPWNYRLQHSSVHDLAVYNMIEAEGNKGKWTDASVSDVF